MEYSYRILTQDYSVIKLSLLVQGVLGLAFPALALANRNTFSNVCVFPGQRILAFENQESRRKLEQPANRYHLHKSKIPPSLLKHNLTRLLRCSIDIWPELHEGFLNRSLDLFHQGIEKDYSFTKLW
jgi:hypothetical protein